MATSLLRVAAMISILIGAMGCGRHAVRTSPALMVPSSPPHEVPPDDARRRADEKLNSLARRLRQSAHPGEHPREPELQPAPLLGEGVSPTPQPTTGGVVVITEVPTKPSSAPRSTDVAPASTSPDAEHRDRGTTAVAVMIAGVLIGAIKLLPRWTDRV